MAAASGEIDFNNSEVAFRSRSDADLRKAYLLFRSFAHPVLVSSGPKLVSWALNLHLPVTPLIKKTIFDQFCGGETIDDCRKTIAALAAYRVGTILDYSVEGREREEDFDETVAELERVIKLAAGNVHVPFAVFKVTGIGRLALLSKVQSGGKLDTGEELEWRELKTRVRRLCRAAAEQGTRIMIDAEESWIQDPIDALALDMMREFNRDRAVVYNTVQLYRVDRLQYLKDLHQHGVDGGFFAGVKLVRGAYMEKERDYAKKRGRASPIQPDKSATDRAFDEALRFVMSHIDRLAVCAGTHNEASTRLLTELIKEHGLAHHDLRIEFSQLLGMGDHLTFNLAHCGFNVSKYVPYGPVRAVLPYLFRRAEENSSIKGQAGRELQLIEKELRRRHKG